MEYLVTMTTRVPPGTTEQAVAEIRAREAARSRELAAQGHLRRLWRPPLQPGEWRTLGLFAAGDQEDLERALASMPLRVWRSDEVLPLAPHPNDPPAHARGSGSGSEFLTTFTGTVPAGDAGVLAVADARAAEADRSRDLAAQGLLVRLWTLPSEGGAWRALGLWRAADEAQLQAVLASLPLSNWMTTRTTALDEHPNDPAMDVVRAGREHLPAGGTS